MAATALLPVSSRIRLLQRGAWRRVPSRPGCAAFSASRGRQRAPSPRSPAQRNRQATFVFPVS